MPRKIIYSLFSLLLMFSSAFAENTQTVGRHILSGALDGFIRPHYSTLAKSVSELAQATKDMCAAPTAQNILVTQGAFKNASTAWAGIEFFKVGPIYVDNRLERMLFYPDRKGTGQKQVRRALIDQDASVTLEQSLAQKSVAIQGFAALELILFGKGAALLEQGDAFRCEYAMAISQNMLTISNSISQPWISGGKITQQWLAPSDTNPWFTTEPDIVALVVGEIIRGLDTIKDVRIGAFLRKPPKKDRPKSAVLWRSDSTMPMVAANLAGLQSFYLASDISSVLTEKHAVLKSEVDQSFEQVVHEAMQLNHSTADLTGNPDLRQQTLALQQSIRRLIRKLDGEFLMATGLTIGFSFSDGD
jgi:predicted lipoprotein